MSAEARFDFTAPGNDPQNPHKGGGAAGSEGSEGASPGEWGEITLLPGRTDPIPTDALPVLGPLAEAVGRALQVPTDLAVNMGLPLITTAAAGRWIVQVDVGWQEALCLCSLTVAPSGEMKSPTLAVMDGELRRYERTRQAETRAERAEQAAIRDLAEQRMSEARKRAIKGGEAEEQAYRNAARELDEKTVDPPPRLLADDATPEAVVSLLAGYGSIGLVSDEPGLFGIIAGRYSGGVPNVEWFLKASSGSPLKVDRKGRDPEDVPNPALSAACCIQPGRLVELGTVKAFRDSGFLARWLYAAPESAVGDRGPTSPVDTVPLKAWETALVALAKAAQENRTGKPTVLPLSDNGRRALLALRAELEPHLHPDHGHYAGIADWCNKLVGTTARIAAALTLLKDPEAKFVPTTIVDGAVRVARAYITHAIAAFGLTRPNAEMFSRARQVLGMIRRHANDDGRVARREVHQHLRDRAWVESVESLFPALDLLAERGYIRQLEIPTGGRPSPVIDLHPECRPSKPTERNER